MRDVRAALSCIVALLLFNEMLAAAAVRGDKAAYLGGTVATIPENTQGLLDLSDAKEMQFNYGKAHYSIAYEKITTLEFGQKVGRRVGATVALGVTTMGLLALPMLFSKKKKHFLTIGFLNEDGTGGTMVLELAKDTVRTVLPTLEARTGKKVQAEEATPQTGKEKS